jgi:DNA-directed RNA polymerase sigma subunit (sigma70/sigma32)
MRYHDILPQDVADRQEIWELNFRILRARQAGAKLREIGVKLGVGVERIRHGEAQALRAIRQGKRAPILNYFDQVGDIAALAR